MSEDEAFIRAIVSAPGDDLPRLVYADWLDEREDLRGLYIREEVEWAKQGRSEEGLPTATLSWISSSLDPVWVARVTRPPLGVCCDQLKFTDCGPRLAADDLNAVESRLGVRFSPEFTAFLLNYNAGKPIPNLQAPPGKPYPVCDAIEYGFHPIGHEYGLVSEFEQAHVQSGQVMHEYKPYTKKELILLARVNDVDWLLLGTGGNHAEKVYHFNGYDYEWFNPDGLAKHADSLPKYLATLTAEWVHA